MKQIKHFLNKKYTFAELFLGKKINHPINPTKDEIRNVLSGTRKVKHGKSIHAASSYLRRNEGTSLVVANADFRKTKEQESLKVYVGRKKSWKDCFQKFIFF